jgi:replicative DNA helicase
MTRVDGMVPPHDLDAEGAVLGALLLVPGAIDTVAPLVGPDDMYSGRHRWVLEGALAVHTANEPVDLITVARWLKDKNRIEDAGGMAYLSELVVSSPTVNLEAACRIITEKSRMRTLIAKCQRLAAEAYVYGGSVPDYLDRAEAEMHELANASRTRKTMSSMREIFGEVFAEIREAALRGASISGIATGFDCYDRLTGGLHDGEVSIIAARPGMGKTSYAMNVATNVGLADGGVVVFSLEMPKKQIGARVACSEGRVDLSKIRTGNVGPIDWQRLTHAVTHVGAAEHFYVDDKPGASLLEVRSKSRAKATDIARKGKRLRLIVVDYVQLMTGDPRAQSREQEVAGITKGLKELAKELECHVMALSQLNRAVETRGEKSKRPQLSDLRESGAIEQDADTVVFIYREDYYKRDAAERNVAELIISKQRNGPTGTVKVRFDREFTRFDNLADDGYGEEDGRYGD